MRHAALLCAVVATFVAICQANLVYVRGNIGRTGTVDGDPGRSSRTLFNSGTAVFDSYRWNPKLDGYSFITNGVNKFRYPNVVMVKDVNTKADRFFTSAGAKLIEVSDALATAKTLVITPDRINNVFLVNDRVFVVGDYAKWKYGLVTLNGIFEYTYASEKPDIIAVQGVDDLDTAAGIQAMAMSTGSDFIFYAGIFSVKGVRASCAAYSTVYSTWKVFAATDSADPPSSSSLVYLYPNTLVWTGRFSFVPFSRGQSERIYNLAFINFADISDAAIYSAVLGDSFGNTPPNINLTIRATIKGGDDGEVIVAGGFATINGFPVNNIARISGLWAGGQDLKIFPIGSGFDNEVSSLFVNRYPEDGSLQLYAGGKFRRAGGAFANRIAMWDGKKWSPLGGGFDDDFDVTGSSDSTITDKEVW
eukprot:CAMPEP_0184643514 /NCGR_PEP_ID=MMETSP0308-20130426/367_1 /TAXON_ID=38269 /ORGANISM="Gloeochaete witrockiana, Strain SAG 46.84" /LENGTH=418 /DNA_ID=CAMNT_0027071505 /DNA_START=131 /DNA_END=1384 /DNA_ORIENTATION=-